MSRYKQLNEHYRIAQMESELRFELEWMEALTFQFQQLTFRKREQVHELARMRDKMERKLKRPKICPTKTEGKLRVKKDTPMTKSELVEASNKLSSAEKKMLLEALLEE